MKKIIVDVDNILWPMSVELYSRMSNIKPIKPEWTWSWTFFEDNNFTKHEFFEIVHDIHSNQSLYKPYEGASDFTKTLNNLNLEIIIASHRKPEYEPELLKFLNLNDIYYNDIYTGFEKTSIFNDVDFVIDDCPQTIQKAIDMEITVMTFHYNWNKDYFQAHRNSYDDMIKTIWAKLI